MNELRLCLLPMAATVFLLSGAEVRAQATDVDCNKCVDSSDIAVGAVTGGKLAVDSVNGNKIQDGSIGAEDFADKAVTSDKIKNGAVTLNKVVAKLRNDIGTSCPAGKVVVGKDTDGFFICDDPGGSPDYYPYGPQVDVHPTRMNEWTLCYSDLYNYPLGTADIASILAQCSGDKLALACRQVGQTNYALLAVGSRSKVTTDTGADGNGVTTLDNGTEWYFNDTWSWGFAGEGDAVDKNQCDINNTGDNDQRMCWHVLGDVGGYRCGTTENLNGSDQWERFVFSAGQ